MDAQAWALPSVLFELIEQGRWPTSDAPWTDQDTHPRAAGPRVEAIAPDERRICLEQYPFHTIGDEIRGGNGFFERADTAPTEIDPDLALIVADFGLGSDAPIVLDTELIPREFSGSRGALLLHLPDLSRGSQWITTGS